MAKKKHTSKQHSKTHSASESEPKAPKAQGDSRVWQIVSLVLLVALVVSLLINNGGTASPEPTITAKEAGDKAMAYINGQLGGQATATLTAVKEAEDLEGYYLADFDLSGQPLKAYVSYDGKYLIPSTAMMAMEEAQDTTPETTTTTQSPTVNLPKSDKPQVELFVMSHCPFGTQMEKGMLPVVEALGDNIDFELKFVNYAMHGEQEVYEQLNQYCIQKEQNDKFLPYLTCFLAEGDGAGCLASSGIDIAKLEECATTTDEEFDVTANYEDQAGWLNGRFPKFMIYDEENQLYGVRGSPTLVINGKQATSGRDSASILATVCAAFNNAPDACSQQLSSAQPGPGFGFDTTGATTAAQCG